MFDIVMSLYNKVPFVEATIDAVLQQTCREWRLFVVDDGSTDGGPELVRRYSDPRVTLIQQTNQGVGPARNAGIRAGSAEWIAFLDGDDVWNADHLEELEAVRRRYPGAWLIGCGFERFSGKATPRLRSAGAERRRLARYFHESARGRELFFTSSAAARRSAIEQVGEFKPLPGNEDVELWARLALHGPVAVSSKQTVNYRTDSGGITNQLARKAHHKTVKREELSSTIPTLDAALPSINDARLRRDIIEYMDSRIGLAVVAALVAGDIAYARELLRLYEGRPRSKARTAALLTVLPDSIARFVISAGLRMKRTVRRLGR